MKVKELLGMVALDVNANEIGKIVDIDFDTATGKFEKISISLRKNIISTNQIEVDFQDIRSIGDYVLLNIEIDKEKVINEAENKKEETKAEAVEAEVVDEEKTNVDID